MGGEPERTARLEAQLMATPEAFVLPLLTGDGDLLLDWVANHIRRRFDAFMVHIGETTSNELERVRVLAARSRDGSVPFWEYDLEDTPCHALLRGEACTYPRSVAEIFPRDHLLEELSLECYAGIPLLDGARPLGLIAVLDDRPLAPERVPEVEAELAIWADRVGAELAKRRAVRDVRDVLEVAGTSVEESLATMTQRLVSTLRVRGAFIAEATSDQSLRVRAGSLDGRADVLGRRLGTLTGVGGGLFAPEGARVRFAHLELVATYQPESLWVRPLEDSEGEVIGAVGLLHDRPMPADPWHRPVVRAFHARAAVDLGRVRAEEARRAAEQRLWAAQRSESLGVMAGGMAHDFNNLLVGMLSNAELLWELTQSDAARDVIRAAERASSLCRQMLAYAGRTTGRKQPIDLYASVAEAVSLLANSNPPGARVELEPHEGALYVQAVPAQLEQVVLNLLTNAREALKPEGGTVQVALRRGARPTTVSQPPGRPGSDPGREYALLEVRDDGVGMDDDVRHRIFEPFFTTKEQGHGLGLAAVQGIVKAAGGVIQVDTAPGVGTTVRLALPLTAQPAAAPSVGDSAQAAARGGRVLIVDDEPIVLQALERILTRGGRRPIGRASGAEALALVRAGETCDLIIVDLTMPDLDGPATLQALRAFTSAPALVASGFGEHEVLARFDGLGVEGWIGKPFRMREILDAVERAMKGGSTQAPGALGA